VKHSAGVPLSLGLCVRDSSEALFGCFSIFTNLKIEEHPKSALLESLTHKPKDRGHPKSASLESLTHKPKDGGTPEGCFTRVTRCVIHV
jgi:hypothetical protein